MDDLLRQMGLRIYDRRKQLRLTQEELAELSGLTAQTISTAELGKKALRPENIVKLASAMDVSTDYLLLGKVTIEDHTILTDKISTLTPAQYRHLEDIINSFSAAVNDE